MLLRTASALMIVVACCGSAAAADLELLPKGHPKALPPQPPAPSAPVPQPAPVQRPSAPQRLQSPPAEPGKPGPDDDTRLNDLQPPALPAPGADESWWQKVVRSAPNCRTFSDGCRTCDVQFRCSSLPIACQPKEFVCTDPATSQPSK